MKYYVLDVKFSIPSQLEKEAYNKAMQEHRAYMQTGFNEGWILISGPQVNSNGGVVVIKANSLEELQYYFNNDPLKIAGFLNYSAIEYSLYQCQPIVKNWFE
ncbi:MAG: YciI family protein [Ruminiclostridium sp.]